MKRQKRWTHVDPCERLECVSSPHTGKTAGVLACRLYAGYPAARLALMLAMPALFLFFAGGCELVSDEERNDLPRTWFSYCGYVSDWEEDWIDLEEEVIERINEARAHTQDCGSRGIFPPVPPLERLEELTCAARNQSYDMADRSFFAHINPDGEAPWDRMAKAGYPYKTAGENIAGGFPDAADVVEAWLESDGHCANLMGASYTHTGVGFYEDPDADYRYYFTQTFGSSRLVDGSP